jgi:hypothetical protein
MSIIVLKGVIADGQLKVVLPSDAPEGKVEVEIRLPEFPYKPIGDLLDSEIVGMWADREDIKDSIEFVDELRRRASRRTAK